MKKTTIIALTIIILLWTSNSIIAQTQNTTKDVSVTILLNEYYNETKIIDEPIIVRNHDDEPGVDDALLVQIYWNFTENNTIIQEHQEIKSINSFSRKIGKLNITNSGNYYFCAKIEAINYYDNNSENNKECKEIIVNFEILEENETSQNETEEEIIDEEEQTEETNQTTQECKQLTIETKNILYEMGETVNYKIININDTNSSYSTQVTYWIEDLQGEITRAERETTNKAEKSFTPSFNGEEKTYIIKATTKCGGNSEKIIVFKGKPESKEEFMTVTFPETIKEKIFTVNINGYKGNNAKTLITTYAEQNGKIISEKTKAYVKNKNTPYNFDIPILLKGTYDGEITIIVEGLDFKEEKETLSTMKEETIQVKGKIESFYTRNQLFTEIITVYGKILNYEGKTLRIISSKETKEINAINDLKENITISNPEEVVVIEILDKNKVEDIKYIKLGLEVKQTQQKTETINQTMPITEKIKQEIQNFSAQEIKTASITGMATKKTESKFNYILIIIGIIVVMAMLKGKTIIKYVKNAKLFK